MKIQESFQCGACNSFLSHPIDTCPVCGDQFYWLLVTRDEPDREAYLTRMQELMEGRASQDFLTHGGHLWLPHRFWDRCPTGEILEEYAWIKRVELVQHEGMALGLTVCEDAWANRMNYPSNPVAELAEAGADVILNLSASPWHVSKPVERRRIFGELSERHRVTRTRGAWLPPPGDTPAGAGPEARSLLCEPPEPTKLYAEYAKLEFCGFCVHIP